MDKLKEICICSICRDPLFNGVIIDPCKHLFCSFCILNAKRTSCPLCNGNIIQVHSCMQSFLNNVCEILFDKEYQESASVKIKSQYEDNIRRELISRIPRQQIPVNNPLIQLVTSPPPPPSPPSKGAVYIIFGIFFILITVLIVNSYFLASISEKLPNVK